MPKEINKVTEEQMRIFSTNLCSYLARDGKSQIDFANYVGVSGATASEWINAKKYPRLKNMLRIAEFFNVELSDLRDKHKEASRSAISKNKDESSWSDALVHAYATTTRPKQDAVCAVLGIDHVEPGIAPLRVLETSKPPEEEETVRVFRAARTNPGAPASEPGYVEIPKSVLQRLKDAPQNEKI